MRTGLQWALAVVYVSLCLSTALLFPGWARLALVGCYLLYLGWVYWTQEESVARTLDLRPLTRWDVPDYGALQQRLLRASVVLGLRRPPIWAVLETDEPQAIAVDGRKGMVILTTGLLRRFPPEEILAIAGHELQHLASRDSLPAIMGSAWFGMMAGIYDVLRRTTSAQVPFVSFVTGLAALVLEAVIAATSAVGAALIASRSRHQEYLADQAGARVASVTAMVTALRRMEEATNGAAVTAEHSPWSAAWIAQHLYASHPPTEARIRVLEDSAKRRLLDA